MKIFSKYFILFFSLLCLCSINCTEDEGINQPPIADFEIIDRIDSYILISSATDVDNDNLSYEWKSDSEIISINDSNRKKANFMLPEIDESKTIGISHVVYDGETYATVKKDMQLPVLTEVRRWGLGNILEGEFSNNVDYDWYYDQSGTGPHSDVNCGPTTVTMAIKWFDEQFSKTPEDARKFYKSSGGWWGTSNITGYLDKYSVNNSTIELNNADSLIDEIEKGNIIILCLDMFYIRNSTNDRWRIDKFYSTRDANWGHFIILKGYKLVNNQLFFEVYDSNSFGARYFDRSFKGKDRYYRFSDIDRATNIWWDYAIIVSKEEFKSTHGVDTEKIVHKYGK